MSEVGDRFAPLGLPNGRVVQIAGGGRDLSVMGALEAQVGDWEPHVGAFFAQTIQPDWACVDIGAHTLADHRPSVVTGYDPSCAETYFFDTPWRYHDLLSSRFVALFEITKSGWCELACASTEAQARMLDSLPLSRSAAESLLGEVR